VQAAIAMVRTPTVVTYNVHGIYEHGLGWKKISVMLQVIMIRQSRSFCSLRFILSTT
jgi:hypothetical protein